MYIDTETTKNNLLSTVARTWLGHLSFPCWLLSFVYPHTSWMLMADSLLIYTSGRRRKTAHCSEKLQHDGKEEEEEDGGGVSIPVTKGTAPRGSPDVHMWYLPQGSVECVSEDDNCFNRLPTQNLHENLCFTSVLIRASRWEEELLRIMIHRENTDVRSRGRVTFSVASDCKNNRSKG